MVYHIWLWFSLPPNYSNVMQSVLEVNIKATIISDEKDWVFIIANFWDLVDVTSMKAIGTKICSLIALTLV